ncbi:uncharacterized protein LY89DRAFT_667935 [Mollisia scopiformis]|uniref:Uncharacterized protein n=1 Tax=Mollisia scopiformis TaxID=149040 RepID=A0A194XFH2_MOLSC|nr:uncharacterized protein LY89DRAFT_667935 [Mollisia scopiformis]KUJ18884.1 hypothetical protein LY89DRAFT_667935 [Mollisia scopiformis]
MVVKAGKRSRKGRRSEREKYAKKFRFEGVERGDYVKGFIFDGVVRGTYPKKSSSGNLDLEATQRIAAQNTVPPTNNLNPNTTMLPNDEESASHVARILELLRQAPGPKSSAPVLPISGENEQIVSRILFLLKQAKSLPSNVNNPSPVVRDPNVPVSDAPVCDTKADNGSQNASPTALVAYSQELTTTESTQELDTMCLARDLGYGTGKLDISMFYDQFESTFGCKLIRNEVLEDLRGWCSPVTEVGFLGSRSAIEEAKAGVTRQQYFQAVLGGKWHKR